MTELCLRVAVEAHAGQRDKVGLPVILHPLTVGLMGETMEERCVGFLHDTIEDTPMTAEKLLELGVDEAVVKLVATLTHKKEVPYFDYIKGIMNSGDAVAIKVKLNDLHHNLERSEKYGFKAQNEKCRRAIAMINGGKVETAE